MILWLWLACTGWKPSGDGEPDPLSCADVDGASQRKASGWLYGDYAIVPCRGLRFYAPWTQLILMPATSPTEWGSITVGSITEFQMETGEERSTDVWPGRDYVDGSS